MVYYIHWASKFATSDHNVQRRSTLQKQALSTARRRHSCARAPARARMRWQVHGRMKVSGDLVEPRVIKLGDNVWLPVHQFHGDGR